MPLALGRRLELLALAMSVPVWLAREMYRANGLEAFDDAGAVLGVLTDEPQVHWSEAELRQQLGWPAEHLTRTAVRCRELLT